MAAGPFTIKGDAQLRQALKEGNNGVETGGIAKIKVQRDRAYVGFAMLFALCMLMGWIIALLAESRVVVPVVTVIDARGHVVQQTIVTPETIKAHDAVVESKVHDFISYCNTFVPEERQRFSDLCRLHSTDAVAQQYEAEIAPENVRNPYYEVGPKGRRTPRITAINKIGDNGYQVAWESTVERPGVEPKVEYFNAVVRWAVTGKPLPLGDRWENGIGFVATSYLKSQELSRK